jgi:DNA-binding transcriptional LysR family regulator
MDPNFAALGKVSLRQFRAFIAVASTGSFTGAARSLNLTQSAISIMIGDLEEELELRLFDRTSRSVTLTEAGRELLAPAHRALVDLQAAVFSSRELSRKKRGKVRVAATPLFSSLFLPDFILTFQQEFPSVEIVVKDVSAPLLKSLVLEGEVDIVIGTPIPSDTEGPDGIAMDLLYLDEVVLVCKPDHRLANLNSIDWSDLKDEPYIAVTFESGTREIIEAAMANVGVALKPAYEVSSVWTVLGMVAAGLGFAFVTGNSRLLTPLYNVKINRVGNHRIDRPIGIMRHPRRSLTPAAATFAQRLTEWMNAPGRQALLQR